MSAITVTSRICLAVALALPWLVAAAGASPDGVVAADVAQDRAGNRLEPLIERLEPAAAATGPTADGTERDASPRYCTADGQWCLRTTRGADDGEATLEVEQQVRGEAQPRSRFIALADADGAMVRPWPFIIRMASGIGAPKPPRDPDQAALQNVLVGAIVSQQTGYSGGGASASTLTLSRIYHQDDGIQIDPVLSVAADGHSMIRACFGEQDMQQRAGACHDEYNYSVVLGLDQDGQGMPVLRYRSTATRFPAGVSRQGDSLAMGPLKKKDLVTETDEACSFQRVLRFVDGAYQADQAWPDCSDYTEL
ncbi:hypothetical protein [Montanilutibacter psychrotolerans]|uniref:DUF1176 domain-containing protein n=1 Tax=Montanilutibacter psychrotolerans TaxID=1327343 RepID=A0A3M8T3Z2_9GAMM|nr:hypothetical protein [Lysobacter psychrotolerans]RNF85442.1 hypothetical protein EER27_06705 [Lysobacter psychrotolerans]